MNFGKRGECVLVRKNLFDSSLQCEPAKGVRLLEPIKSLAFAKTLPFKVLEDHQHDGEPEVHVHEHDLWICLEGEPIFTYGGELMDAEMRKQPNGSDNPNEWRGSRIENGTTETLGRGDWLWIPAGYPHKHSCATTARLIIVKISVAH